MKKFINNLNIGIRYNAKASKGIVLVSYLGPASLFLDILNFKKHPNVEQIRCFIKILSAHYRFVIFVDYRNSLLKIKSDLLIGFGLAYRNNFPYSKRRFYFATGSSSEFVSNEILRAKSHLDLVNSSEILWRNSDPADESDEINSERILLIGNDFTKSTFRSIENRRISLLPGNFLNGNLNDAIIPKSIKLNTLLWFGSNGLLHKGLDIAANVASIMNCKLIVVGVSPHEFQFAHDICNKYSLEYELNGFLSLKSTKWSDILKSVTFALFPSISEGMSTGVLTSIFFGLYPLVTDRCGCDVGHLIEFKDRSNLVHQFTDELVKLTAKDEAVIHEKIYLWQNQILQKNSLKSFCKSLNEVLKSENFN
jgi:hypothetical protein